MPEHVLTSLANVIHIKNFLTNYRQNPSSHTNFFAWLQRWLSQHGWFASPQAKHEPLLYKFCGKHLSFLMQADCPSPPQATQRPARHSLIPRASVLVAWQWSPAQHGLLVTPQTTHLDWKQVNVVEADVLMHACAWSFWQQGWPTPPHAWQEPTWQDKPSWHFCPVAQQNSSAPPQLHWSAHRFLPVPFGSLQHCWPWVQAGSVAQHFNPSKPQSCANKTSGLPESSFTWLLLQPQPASTNKAKKSKRWKRNCCIC